MKNELGIGLSPITDKIYLGKQNKAKRMWVGEKKDITENFLDVMFEYLSLDDVREIVTENDNEKQTKHFFIHFTDDSQSIEKSLSFINSLSPTTPDGSTEGK